MTDENKQTERDWDSLVPEATPARVLERIQAARLALGLSQKAFAAKAGISPQRYTNWKNHGARPSIDEAIMLCRAHRLTLEFLFRDDWSGVKPPGVQAKVSSYLLRIRRKT